MAVEACLTCVRMCASTYGTCMTDIQPYWWWLQVALQESDGLLGRDLLHLGMGLETCASLTQQHMPLEGALKALGQPQGLAPAPLQQTVADIGAHMHWRCCRASCVLANTLWSCWRTPCHQIHALQIDTNTNFQLRERSGGRRYWAAALSCWPGDCRGQTAAGRGQGARMGCRRPQGVVSSIMPTLHVSYIGVFVRRTRRGRRLLPPEGALLCWLRNRKAGWVAASLSVLT